MTVLDRDRWQLLGPLLDRALDLTPEERGRWLDQLSTSSPALATVLTSLLAGELAADRVGFLTTPPQPTLAGLELGAWRLERSLGQGGMGTVWLASRADGRFEGHAAVKILNLALLSAEGQERFRREGSLLARLSHPGIARLLDAGVGGAGQPYLVLEYVDGRPIDAYARGHELAPAGRIHLFQQVLAAVGHAHAHLIVHRDLKPSNILVTPEGQVKLLDFGIAKLLDAPAGGVSSASTFDGKLFFTPQCAAPEQVRGEPLTTATDVYALGVLLYLLLSGRHPTGEDCFTPAESVRALLETEPARLGFGDLDTVLAKALRKLPAERYQTVAAFADDLDRYLRQEPVSARAHSAGYRLKKFVRRNQAAVLAGALTAAGLIGATAFSLEQMGQAKWQRDAAVHERERADAQVEFQNVLLSEVGDRPITMREVLDAGREVLERQSAGDPRLRTALLLQLAGSYGELDDTEERGAVLARAESLAVAGRDTVQLAELRCNLADAMRKDGRYDEARRALDRAGPLAWQPAIHYAETALAQGDADSALKYFGIIVAQGIADTSRFWEGRGLYGLARAQVQLGRLAAAGRAAARVERIAATLPHLRDTDDQIPDSRALVGWIALAERDPARASSQFMSVLRSNGFSQGKERKRLRPIALATAECALSLGRTAEALALAGQARTIATLDSLADGRSAWVGEARLIEGRALFARGDSLAGRTAVERALAALRFGAGPQHRRTREAAALAATLER